MTGPIPENEWAVLRHVERRRQDGLAELDSRVPDGWRRGEQAADA